MWQATHSRTIRNIDKTSVWAAWADVNHWNDWDKDLDYATLDGEFNEGETFMLKPRGGPRVKINILRVAPMLGYTDLTHFPLAKMYGIHDMEDTADGLRLTITIRIEGPLAWLWRKIVAQKVADESPAQMQALGEFIQRNALQPA
ncbi:MAG: SRPBCC family protein [Gemmatimonadaceae bacterium]